MILGQVRSRFPRVILTLHGLNGPVDIEFVVDTAFDGDLALPAALLGGWTHSRSDAQPVGQRGLSLADGSLFVSGACEIVLDWEGEPRLTEVLILDGNPLLGVVLMEGFHLGLDMEQGGEVLESL